MAHARTIPFLLTALALVLVLPGVLSAGETKEFEDHGFSWTIPDGWSFMEVNSGEQNANYVAKAGAGAGDGYVVISLRSLENDDPDFLRELTEEVRRGIAGQLPQTSHSSTGKGSLGGVKGTLIRIKGKNERDEPVSIRIYSIQAGDRIHQLFVQITNTSDATLMKSTDEARRGFKLKSGGGEEPADPELAEGSAAPEEGEADEEDDEEDDEGGDDAGDGMGKSPKVDGNTILFGARNLKWTIPEGSPFEWNRTTSDQTIESGVLCVASASIDLDVSEEAAARGAPTESTCEVLLFVQPEGAGGSPEGMVKHQGNQAQWEASFFDKVDYGRVKTVDKLPVGNHHGAALMMVGAKDGAVRYLRVYAVALKGTFYRFEAILTGNSQVNNDFGEPLKQLMANVEFIDTKTWVRGPLAVDAVPPHNQKRGHHAGEEREVRSMGFTAEKPAAMSDIEFAKGGNYRLAWELRSKDKQNYLYFDVQTWSKKSVQGARNFEIDRVKDREGQWKEHANSPQTIKKGKEPYFKASFGKGKGYGYEFRGYLGEAPFVERGYVVEYKKYYYWIRIQLGGEDAEDVFAKELKGLKKAIKYSR